MKGMRIGAIGIILLMLLMSFSVVYGQEDQAAIDQLLQKRDRLTAEMNGEVPIKEAFDKTIATKVCSANQCTFTGKDGRVLKEEYDGSGNLATDTFTDPINKMELVTQYTTNKGVICISLKNNAQQDKLRLCNACPLRLVVQQATNTERNSYGAYQDQAIWDLLKGYILRLKVSCCGIVQDPPILGKRCTNTLEFEFE